ncbi:hypothetical protein VE01_02904 [Pseudogymnoascus verrucosus]|uniref:Glycosyl hydrolase family 13 catalytic domain-containing protein n=1 Tax=Pseudogymnoascus verrucosus TaxID=342668 RepID=A0A1B8GUD8_9PEZI|nr:uncharacterized protein VE01_02904 [Pseudogymnoascus verrucosus]OBT99448.1 hypothetical protein VE01_02904 [Pseudogymnoascus verrucosus]
MLPALNPPRLGNRAWWKEASVYQIYPASFKDSNGDGIGDIPGITSELDYLKSLGVDLVWLSPILQSPQVDMGYDISDYRNIHAPYGTMDDHDNLIKGLHSRGMKYVMDLVVNHTSDQHEWFKESRSSKDNKYRDWYIWKDPKIGADGRPQPPNNWASYFGGSAWKLDEQTNQYYLHLFATEQPDLNWENPDVRDAVHSLIRFWLDKGVDGFRMDVINFISKVPGFPDAPIQDPTQEFQSGNEFYACGPRLHEFLKDIGAILKEYDAFSVGEMPGVTDPEEILKSVAFDRGELNMIFHFEIVDLDHGPGGKFTPRKWRMSDLKSVVEKWQHVMIYNGGWNALYLENHDQGRVISRFASDNPEWRALSGKMLATFLALQSGTVFVYQGQELAMKNVPAEWTIDDFRDIETLNHWHELLAAYPDDKERQAVAMQEYRIKSRDNARTPMQWNKSAHAGFTTGEKPWINVHGDYETWNAEAQVNQPDSVYHYWAKLLKLRLKLKDVIVYGDFIPVGTAHNDVFAYMRSTPGSEGAALVVANFRAEAVSWKVPTEVEPFASEGQKIIGNYETGPTISGGDTIELRPFEAVVYWTT